MRDTARMRAPGARFTERGFYLDEFRGRTIGFVWPGYAVRSADRVHAVLDELRRNGTRDVVLVDEPSAPERLGLDVVAPDDEGWPAAVWEIVGAGERGAALLLDARRPESAVAALALRLGLPKVVWLRPEGGLAGEGGRKQSFMDLDELRRFVASGASPEDERPVLAEIVRMLEGGVPSVNLCSCEGLDEELFTYSGSGTLFTRERYADVRPLRLDDYDAAQDLIARGVAEGYLLERDPSDLRRVLSGGIGVFIEGRDLAGVGALLTHAEAGAAEIACLYTVTRYLGEGVGQQIVRHAVDHAAHAGLAYVFACTTSDRVATFFEQAGFARVDGSKIPAAKWDGYPSERRARLLCLRHDLPR
jgi:amino-acid N-acetyltransferase